MPRIRTIKPEFYRHHDLFLAEQEFKLPLRVAFSGLWLCADKEGRFKWKPTQLKLDILPYDDLNFEDVLNSLVKTEFIIKYTVEGKVFGFIPTFTEHQRITGTERLHESKLPPPDGNTKESQSVSLDKNVITQDTTKGSHKNTQTADPQMAFPNVSKDSQSVLGKEEGIRNKDIGKDKASTPELEKNNFVCYNAEKYIIENQGLFEGLCMATGRKDKEVKHQIHIYHLWMEKNEKYPIGNKAALAGVESWILGSDNFNNKYHRNGLDKPPPSSIKKESETDFNKYLKK